MTFIVVLLGILATGTFIWTVIQIIQPHLFYKAEEEANMKQKRPLWYLVGGIVGIFSLVILWILSFRLQMVSVWIMTVLFTLGSVKAFGIVFFYKRFSGSVSNIVNSVQRNKKAYVAMVLSRAFLFLILLFAALYFAGCFVTIR